MLPTEILLQVVDNLDPSDILALSSTNKSNYGTLISIRNLLLESPYYLLNYSQYPSWQACANNYTTDTSEFEHVTIPTFIDTPLPDDFQALQGDRGRKTYCPWNACDRGLYTRDEDRILDLRSDSGEESYPTRAELMPWKNIEVKYGQAMNMYHTKDCAVTSYLTDDNGVDLVLAYKEDGSMPRYQISDTFHRSSSYILQGFENNIVLHKREPDNNSYGLDLFVKGRNPIRLGDMKSCGYGLLMYNGQLFKAVHDEDRELHIVPAHSELGEDTKRDRFKIFQDDRFPRYAMTSTVIRGLPEFVIDLKTHQVASVGLDPHHVPLVGISQGKLGVWKYSQRYLCDKAGKSIGTDRGISEIFSFLIVHFRGVPGAFPRLPRGDQVEEFERLMARVRQREDWNAGPQE